MSNEPNSAQATQPAEVTDKQIKMLIPRGDAWKYEIGFPEAIKFARAILALRPERVPMTEEEIFNAYCKSDSILSTHITNLVAFAKAIEAHHGITAQTKKETP